MHLCKRLTEIVGGVAYADCIEEEPEFEGILVW